jgi:alkylation response protein AidB-like acyl-CoA dehydrogenase
MNAKPAGPEAAVRKMVAAPHGQRIVDLAKRVQGMSGLITGNGAFEPTNGGRHMFDDWDYAFWFNPAVTLGVGTQEVLKNIISERVLGLPREADPTAKTPWAELQKSKLKTAV